MSIAQRLVNFSDGLSADGVLSAAKGGTGTTTGAGSSTPTISAIGYSGDDTATNPAGGATITLTGTNFAAGAKVLINTTPVGVVTVVSATQITFTAPQLAAGSYILYVVNSDGSTAIAVPGIQYSGTPAWTTAAGSLGTGYETSAVSTTVSAASDSAVTYSVVSGTLPSGVTINSSGTISGTSPLVAGSTTYTFTVRATDAENQDTDRSFSLTINPDVVTWSAPANGATLTGGPGIAYTSALSATSAAGQTVSYSADALPAGLAISGSTITGTPTAAGTSSTTLTATSAVTNKSAQVTVSWTINIAADTYFPLTTLLLNSETTALPFLADASTNNFAITAVGDTKPNNFNPYTPGYYSNYFDGNGDVIYATESGGAFTFGTGDYEYSAWIFTTDSGSAQQTIFSRDNTGNAAVPYIYIQPTNRQIGLYYSSFIVGGTTAIAANKWYYITVSRVSGTSRIFVNGVLEGSAADSTNLTAAGKLVVGGQWTGNTNMFVGYISNARVVKGSGVTSVTVPTTPLTAITNTQLLTCQSNRLIDNSANAFALTKTGDVTVSPFDPFVPDASYATYGSTYFDGTGDYVRVPASSNLSFSTDFTIECWVNTSTTSLDPYGRRLWSFGDGAAFYLDAPFYNGSSTTANMCIQIASTGIVITGTRPVADGQWHHVALTRAGSSMRLFVDGIQSGSTYTNASAFTAGATNGMFIGCLGAGVGGFLQGNVSDFRVVNGTALYTANFAPPATPLTAVANTSLLTLQTNQPHTNSQFLDNSTSALPITRAGNTTQGSFSPYGANWSNYLPSAGSTYLFGGSSTSLALGPGNFTLEGWFYIQALAPSYSTLFDWRTNGSIIATVPVVTDFNNNGKLAFVYGNGSSTAFIQVVESSTTMPVGSWFHMALVRSGTTVTMYFNGTSVGSATSSQDFGLQNFNIGNTQSTNYTPSMYVSNVRLVKGSAVYTSAFTPSTTPLTAITNTTLLTCQSPRYVDNSINNIALSATTNVSVQKFSPFSLVTQTPTTHSVYFDGSGDYLQYQGSATKIIPSEFVILYPDITPIYYELYIGY